MINKEELAKKASEQACENERIYGGCAQCVLGAIKTTLGNIPDDVFKSATGLAGGIARTGAACGALTGGVMALSMFYGRDFEHFDDPDKIRFTTFQICEKLVDRFKKEYGSPNCWDIQTKIMGRSYNISRPDEYEEFLAQGGHEDKCPLVCGNSAKWVIEILDEEGLLNSPPAK